MRSLSITYHGSGSIFRLACLCGGAAVLGQAGCTPRSAGIEAGLEGRTAGLHSEDDYVASVQNWREERVKRLTRKDGWLSLAGLYWLREGINTFGADPSHDLVIPEGKAPSLVGSFILEDGRVRMMVQPNVAVLHDGEPVQNMGLIGDAEGKPTVLRLGSLSWHIIERSGRVGVRLRDAESETVRQFKGIECFPIERAWRVPAVLEPYEPAKEISVPTVIGTESMQTCPGALVFKAGGKICRLDTILYPDDDRLFVVFSDRTSARETYGGGRFLYVDPPDEEGHIVIDFNKAYNPPCAFTPYATCPMPPSQNRLPIRVTAGEKRYESGHH